MSASDDKAMVVIVGAGPTGVMLAIELARRGIEVSVLDKQPVRSSESRAIGIHARTLEVFDQLGIVERFVELGHRVDGLAVHRRTGRPVRIHFSGIDSFYPFMLTLSQAETQRILKERLEDLGVSVQRGARVLDLREDEGWRRAADHPYRRGARADGSGRTGLSAATGLTASCGGASACRSTARTTRRTG